MALTKLGIYNAVLRKCRSKKLADLTENRKSRRSIDSVWSEDPIRFCLEQGQWQFATKSIKLEPDETISPSFGRKYAFRKTDDYVRTVAISFNEFFHGAETQYEDEGNYIYADVEVVYLKFVSDAVDYGRDYSLWPKSFDRLVVAHIAQEIVGDLTDSTTLEDKIEREYDKRLKKAQGLDGVNRPTRFMPSGSWSNARHGSSGHNRENG